jgi:REP-associated tyrosine transposase
MPRHARLMLPDVSVHIVQRGNNRTACFFADEDYACYLFHLEELAQRFECAVHAWCLMTNHVHLLVTPGKAKTCALLMKHLGQHYVQYVNRVRRRTGTLWEGRFRSCLAQSEDYVLACYRYIELNPVRARMVNHPRDYSWSSYRVNAEGSHSSLVTPHAEYVRLGEDRGLRRVAYRALLAEQLDSRLADEIRSATTGGFVLGSESFQQEIGLALGRRTHRSLPGRPAAIDRLPRPNGKPAE